MRFYPIPNTWGCIYQSSQLIHRVQCTHNRYWWDHKFRSTINLVSTLRTQTSSRTKNELIGAATLDSLQQRDYPRRQNISSTWCATHSTWRLSPATHFFVKSEVPTFALLAMPSQTRGFFACDYCGRICDTLDEAKEHELHSCPKRPQQGNQSSVTETPAQPSQGQTRLPASGHPTPFGGMPPPAAIL